MAIDYRSSQNRYKNSLENKYKYNEQIESPSLRVISEEGEQLGIMKLEEARNYAKEQDLDLIEIVPNADPPIAKVEAWSKFKFELLKKEKAAKKKNKSKEMKEMWFYPLMGKGDMDHKIHRVKEFLADKHSVRIVIKLHGRVAYDLAKDLMQNVLMALDEFSVVDTAPKYEAKQILAILRPGKKS